MPETVVPLSVAPTAVAPAPPGLTNRRPPPDTTADTALAPNWTSTSTPLPILMPLTVTFCSRSCAPASRLALVTAPATTKVPPDCTVGDTAVAPEDTV